ncbi:LamG-like jellyroll fold domain-containing protein [Kribbella sp. VKM Ac-2568]|uniref:LamG-like jellyroll fold domain-containing protein n=1 Tax=Kribbella sp. VKM Ac-2568 TaxID=2512219 RepID=UPI001047392B|nr:LamG-like jellyroll fold domain-containing protein [Kribbella sp. VKM Ac-2568]TCM37224.1 concanavalin A-like lectin/glucanase superfamily protein [Kribbella sp. VKM Ac-2568]
MAQAAGYTFNADTVDGTTVRDVAGYFLHGTIVGSAALTTGRYGNGLNCTGGAMHVLVRPPKAGDDFYPLNTDGGLSVAAWVQLNTNTVAARCIASATSDGTLNWAVYASNATGNVEARIAGATYSTSTSIRDGQQHHVLVVYDATPSTDTVKIAVDGVQVLSVNAGAAMTYSDTEVTMEAGRNTLTGTDALDGIVDDLRWWNDPVEAAYWPTLVAAEQIDHQLAVYPFDNDTAEDFGSYGRDLAVAPSASFTTGLYGGALVSGATAAGATGAVNFPDCDRLAICGWLRLDTAPVGSPAPILAINDTLGSARVRVVVNTARTVTATWTTIDDGTVSVTSTATLTVGQWTRFQFAINPTYVQVRLEADNATANIGDGVPHVTPAIDGLDQLHVGGDATAGGRVSYDYLTFTKNFLAEVTSGYWSGAPVVTPYRPANAARGVYHFNENTGTIVDDKSPSGNDLTLTAAGSWVTGVQGSALGSNGTGPGASRTSFTWPASPPGWAFSAWVKCRTSSSGARFLVLRNGGGEVAHAGYLDGLFWVRLFGASGTTGIINSTRGPIAAETWTHVAASCDQKAIQFFLNGKMFTVEPYSVGALLQPNELNVGGDNPDSSVADVDDLRLFDSPISAANVRWLHQNPGQYYDAAPATFAAWGVPL